GLRTPAAFHASLHAAAASPGPHAQPLACAAIELDFFDHLVQQFGSPAEEQLLSQFGSLLNQLSAGDRAVMAHFEGGRFCAMLAETTGAEAVRWAERVRTETAARKFLVGERDVSLTVSAGVAVGDPAAAPAEAILEKSRQALRMARASGHDCVVLAGQFAEEEAAWKELAAPGRLFERTVARDVMLPCTVVLHSKDAIGVASSLCQQTHLASLVVVDRQEKLVGMVFADDVAAYLQASGDPAQPVSRIMTQRIDTFGEDTPFAEIIRRFAEKEVEAVVVVDGDFPTGVVSAASLASLSQVPGQPAFCLETPSLQSGYLQLAEPFAVAPACAAT
ncbi:MAG: diguanylate cyclase domain-containing protein, partial [Thermoguttaceae bacterium]